MELVFLSPRTGRVTALAIFALDELILPFETFALATDALTIIIKRQIYIYYTKLYICMYVA